MKIKYPLEQVLAVKKDRVEKAERVVEQKIEALKTEEKKLKKAEQERDKVLHHHADKLSQMRHALDTGTTSDEVLQMKVYFKEIKEKLAKEEIKVQKQQEQVKIAGQHLEEAKLELKQKRLEEEKIQLHKQNWTKEMKIEFAQQEAKEQDEIGQVLYEGHRRKKKESS